MPTVGVDNVGALTEDDFPTGRVRTLENTMLHFLRNKTSEGINDMQESNKNIQEICENIQETNKDILQNFATSREDAEAIKDQVAALQDSVAIFAACVGKKNII